MSSRLNDRQSTVMTAVNETSYFHLFRSSVKRVAATLDAIDHKKFRDKFGDQFNYS